MDENKKPKSFTVYSQNNDKAKNINSLNSTKRDIPDIKKVEKTESYLYSRDFYIKNSNSSRNKK